MWACVCECGDVKSVYEGSKCTIVSLIYKDKKRRERKRRRTKIGTGGSERMRWPCMAFHIVLASKEFAALWTGKVLWTVRVMSEDMFFHVVCAVASVRTVWAAMDTRAIRATLGSLLLLLLFLLFLLFLLLLLLLSLLLMLLARGFHNKRGYKQPISSITVAEKIHALRSSRWRRGCHAWRSARWHNRRWLVGIVCHRFPVHCCQIQAWHITVIRRRQLNVGCLHRRKEEIFLTETRLIFDFNERIQLLEGWAHTTRESGFKGWWRERGWLDRQEIYG